MEAGMVLSRFDGQSKLLVQALLSGVSGHFRALGVFVKQHRAGDMSLSNFIENLCREEIYSGDTEVQPLKVQPLVCLFPTLFKQNLLSFIHLIQPTLPQSTILPLLKCLEQDPHLSPWVTALVRQVKRSMGLHDEGLLCSPACSERLMELSQRFTGCGETRGWAKSLSHQTEEFEFQRASGLSEFGPQRKRKSSFVSLDSDNEGTEQKNKRMKTDVSVSEGIETKEPSLTEKLSAGLESDAQTETLAEQQQPAPEHPCDLPEHMKVTVLQLKELLESQTEWDQSSNDMFRVLVQCDPTQLELLCNMLSFPDLPEQILPKLCSSVLAPSLDISYSTAATLIRSLLLEKVLSLSEPASRCLVTAASSMCSHCPRPMCHALIEPLLQDKSIGNPQAEFLNRLIEGCLDSHYKLLVLQMTLNVAWNEAVLSIIHSLLDTKLDLSEEVFTHFSKQLVSQGPQFTKSVKFAKMILTVLTKYSTCVTVAHKQSLSGCLAINETFLKKPLQAALKRISDS